MTMTNGELVDMLIETGVDTDELHAVPDNADAQFTWDYGKGRRANLDKLYEKAKRSQWNASTDLDWSIDVDPERTAIDLNEIDMRSHFVRGLMGIPGSPLENWGQKEWREYCVENVDWRISQFLHGEQGALLCSAKIVETVPWIDAKYYAATQVVDEARHVEVFSRYQAEKCNGSYQMNAHLQSLIDDILEDSRWDVTYLGMQIMIEGLALTAFGGMQRATEEPLLKQLLKYVMADEARHVAFGVLSLTEVYQGLNQAEIRERQEFALEAAVRMRDRFLQQEVWERMGVDTRKLFTTLVENRPENNEYQALLFSKVVPNCRKMGLLDAGDGWLREQFTDIGIIAYEHADDTATEVLG